MNGITSKASSAFSQILGRHHRKLASEPWETLPQPVPLIQISSHNTGSSVQHVALGITPQAEAILSQLSDPLYLVAFLGFGRSGKSYTATKVFQSLSNSTDFSFPSYPGNVPITHGIDMMVMKHPTSDGHVVFLDCEGGGNHNQSALPFVIGLAARLASKLVVFERGCFTTNGLEIVMQIMNMGLATVVDDLDLTKSLLIVENMSINASISHEQLLEDLLSKEDGDEDTNRIRQVIRDHFDVEFAKIPFNFGGNEQDHTETCKELGQGILNNLTPFVIGNVPVDGVAVVQLVQELVTQIRNGGSKFNMVSATESMVSNMANEAAYAMWSEFVMKVKKTGNHPSQITGRKHLKTILREVEGLANTCMNELEGFTCRLIPSEPAFVAQDTWTRNYTSFIADIKATHQRKSEQLAKYTQWADRMNRFVNEIISQVIEAIRQLIRFARFSTSMVILSNYYIWKHSLNLVTGLASGVLNGSSVVV